MVSASRLGLWAALIALLIAAFTGARVLRDCAVTANTVCAPARPPIVLAAPISAHRLYLPITLK